MNRFALIFLRGFLITGLLLSGGLGGESISGALPENYHSLSPRISSSGQPLAEEVFAAIAREGIKTVVSVDGAAPDLHAAERHGIRYVHLPIGYDGVPAPAIAALGKLLSETEGRILIHCHHGKHRGPAAAAIACLIEGSMSREEALAALEAAGTSPDYAGLWRDVCEFTRVPDDVVAAPLVSRATVAPFVAAMVAIDHAFEAVTTLAARGTAEGGAKALPAAALHEQSALLVEGFREALRHVPESLELRDELASRLRENVRGAERLRDAARGTGSKALHATLAGLQSDCRSCHRKFRD